jgi:hypothetical protein
MKMNFNTLYKKMLSEHVLERDQQGGFQLGDRVIFKKDWQKNNYFDGKGASFLETIKSCSAPDFDIPLRISSFTTLKPTSLQDVGYGKVGTAGILVDIVIEYAPGLFRNPMTVPIEVLERQDDGINLGPRVDSWRRKSSVHKPEEIKTQSTAKFDVNLINKNTVLPTATKSQDDTKPSKNWKPFPTK